MRQDTVAPMEPLEVLGSEHSRVPTRDMAAWSLDPEAVDLFVFELREHPGDLELLDDEERARADRLIIESKRAQFVAGRSLLRRLLAQRCGLQPAALRFGYGEHGKPELARDATPGAVAFNLSHSHEQGLLAVAPASVGTIGVDVEHRRAGRAFEAIAERFFSPPEIEQLLAAEASQRPEMFYRAWAQKEAYLKAWGTGLTFSSQRFTVTMGRERPPAILATQMPGDEPARWILRDVWVGDPGGPGYSAALCMPRAHEGRYRCFRVR